MQYPKTALGVQHGHLIVPSRCLIRRVENEYWPGGSSLGGNGNVRVFIVMLEQWLMVERSVAIRAKELAELTISCSKKKSDAKALLCYNIWRGRIGS